MSAITVRNISQRTHAGLRERARRHGRSTEAEVRHILDAAAEDGFPAGLGSALAELGRRYGLDKMEWPDRTDPPIDAAVFEE